MRKISKTVILLLVAYYSCDITDAFNANQHPGRHLDLLHQHQKTIDRQKIHISPQLQYIRHHSERAGKLRLFSSPFGSGPGQSSSSFPKPGGSSFPQSGGPLAKGSSSFGQPGNNANNSFGQSQIEPRNGNNGFGQQQGNRPSPEPKFTNSQFPKQISDASIEDFRSVRQVVCLFERTLFTIVLTNSY